MSEGLLPVQRHPGAVTHCDCTATSHATVLSHLLPHTGPCCLCVQPLSLFPLPPAVVLTRERSVKELLLEAIAEGNDAEVGRGVEGPLLAQHLMDQEGVEGGRGGGLTGVPLS